MTSATAADARVTLWTTAPKSYDGFGTETAEGPYPWDGEQLRRVLVDPAFQDWQSGRYWSGCRGSWDEDPRIEEARRRETSAREKAERENAAKRRAEGLVWIQTADLPADEDAADAMAHERGLTWQDVRAERQRRTREGNAVKMAEQWAKDRATFADGATIVDLGTPGFRGYQDQWIPGREPNAWRDVRVEPHWCYADDSAQAIVWGEGRQRIGTLADVAHRFAIGEYRAAGPNEVVPPRAVVDRIGCRYNEVARAEVGGKVAWAGRPLGSLGVLVVDDRGHLVRAKALREAAEQAHRAWRATKEA